MRKFKFAKLVRDKIVEGIKKSGNKPDYRVLEDKEYIEELKRKLLEEAEEIPLTDNKNLIKEIADIQEIIDNLIPALGYTKKDLKSQQEEKNKKGGSFKEKLYVDTVEADEDSEWIDYYLKYPDKYPEIKEDEN